MIRGVAFRVAKMSVHGVKGIAMMAGVNAGTGAFGSGLSYGASVMTGEEQFSTNGLVGSMACAEVSSNRLHVASSHGTTTLDQTSIFGVHSGKGLVDFSKNNTQAIWYRSFISAGMDGVTDAVLPF